MKFRYLKFLFAMVVILASCSQNEKKENDSSQEEMKSNVISLLSGTYTSDDGSKGIYRLAFDETTGILENEGLVAEARNPSFLAISNDNNFVYAVNEIDSGRISAYEWSDVGHLQLLNSLSSKGKWPCFIDLNNNRTKVSVANYGSGNVVIATIDENGKLESSPVERQHIGKGPNAERQEGPHAHFATFGPNNRFIFSIDLGIDQILSYAIEGEEIGETKTAMSLEGGDGPRHLTFHPNGKYAYVLNELSSTVVAMEFDAEMGAFSAIGRQSTLPEDYTGDNACADIHISNDGKFLYASNRGHDSIVMYKVLESGNLTYLGNEPVHGNWPRNFTLSPDNKYLLVANQHSNNITVFNRNPDTGLLNYTHHQVTIDQPVCLKFFN